ncbi:MAG: DsrE family protein [Sulfuriflexus sp.]|nr:DsrE family protein [Sulfuriflexus sp.]
MAKIRDSLPMRKSAYLLIFLAVSGWMTHDSLWPEAVVADDNAGPTSEVPDKAPWSPSGEQRFAYDIVLHKPEEIHALLRRAEKLAKAPRPASEQANIAMVLHGPEIDIFAINNYPKYREIVDLAAKLDAYNVIEIKMCQSVMRKRGLKNHDVPGFIELVPYAPAELEKLRQRDYVVL